MMSLFHASGLTFFFRRKLARRVNWQARLCVALVHRTREDAQEYLPDVGPRI